VIQQSDIETLGLIKARGPGLSEFADSISIGRYIIFGHFLTDPSTTGWDLPEEGRFWYNSDDDLFKYWDGVAVQSLLTSGAAICNWVKVGNDIYYSDGIVGIRTMTDAVRDAELQFAVGAADLTKFTIGVDDSDRDKWKLAVGGVLGATKADAIVVETSVDRAHKINLQTWDVSPSVELAGFELHGSYIGGWASSATAGSSLTIDTNVLQLVSQDQSSIAGCTCAGSWIVMYGDRHSEDSDGLQLETHNSDIFLETQYWPTGGPITKNAKFRMGYLGAATLYASLSFNIDSPDTTILKGQALRFQAVDAVNSIGLGAPATVSASYLLTLPGTGPTVAGHFAIAASGLISWGQDVSTTAAPSFTHVHATVADGTPPLEVNSTTKVTNLNADRIDGYHLAYDVGYQSFVIIG